MSLIRGFFPSFPASRSPGWGAAIVFLATVAVLSATVPSIVGDLINPVLYTQGQVATHTVRAPRDVLVEDTLGTEKRRDLARQSAVRVFSINYGNDAASSEELEAVFSALRELPLTGPKETILAERSNFERRFNLDLVGKEWDAVLDRSIWSSLEENVRKIVNPILRTGIIANKRPLRSTIEQEQSAVLVNDRTGVSRELNTLSSLYDLQEAEEVAAASFPMKGFKQGPTFDSLVKKLTRNLLRANVIYDMVATETRIQQEAAGVDPVYYRIKRGEVVVRAGDVINSSQERKLQLIHEEVKAGDAWRQWGGYFILTAVTLLTLYAFTLECWHDRMLSTGDLLLVSLTLVGSFTVMKLFWVLSNSLSHTFYFFDPSTYILATPVAAGGILLQVTLGAPGVLLFVMSFALLTGVFLENSWIVLMMIVVGNIVGALAVRRCSRRSAFIWAGSRVAAVNVIVVLCFLLLFSEYSAAEMANRVLWAIVGGALSGILGAGLTPIAEHCGGYITDIKLLELASLDHPLLRELSVQAPGTWNHSMVLGQMGEAAAEAIGANSLLTRVGAYYHDVGKMKKPAYFVENQTKENRHDKLTTSMSALIIKTHVKDGIELAEKSKLPQAIIDFIAEHHGTSLIEFFYNKALSEADDEDDVQESHYRYAGPKPQSKETGILMMADTVEASSRTLADPTPAKIQGLVQKMINKIFASGQLEESSLTLKDLHFVAKAFTRVLTGIYHRRIEYSEPADKSKESKPSLKAINTEKGKSEKAEVAGTSGAQKGDNGNRAPGEGEGEKPTDEASSKKSDAKDGKETLKRLGI